MMNILLPLFDDFNKDNISKIIPLAYLEGFSGKPKETIVYVSHQNEKVIALGLGGKKDFKSVKSVFRSFFYNNRFKLSGDVKIQ